MIKIGVYENIEKKQNIDITNEGKRECDDISFENKENNNNNSLNFVNKFSNKRKKKQKVVISPNSSKYIIFIVTLWGVALISIIIGFVVHYETAVGVTASSVLLAFAFIMCVIGSVFTYLYKKSVDAEDIKEKIKLLSYFPVC